MKARAKDWNTKLVGRPVWAKDRVDEGSLCGYTTDGDGNITVVMVAFYPGDREEFAAEDVEMAT